MVAPTEDGRRRRNATDVRACLAGKRVEFYGNSVSRHWAFVLAAMLSSPSDEDLLATDFKADREEEKRRCGGGHPWPEPSDALRSCELDVGDDTSLAFFWSQNVWNELWDQHFAASNASVQVVSVGSDDVFNTRSHDYDDEYWQSRLGDSTKLAAALAARSRQASVYFRTSTPVCHAAQNETEWHNSRFQKGNANILDALCQRGDADAVRVIDAFDWKRRIAVHYLNSTDHYCAFYDDEVHHSKLAFLEVYRWLGDLCDDAEAFL